MCAKCKDSGGVNLHLNLHHDDKHFQELMVKKEFCLLGYNTMLSACFMLLSCLAYSSALKMEMKCSSDTSFDFHRNAQCYIPEDNFS
jgi:hypothetical protein